MILTCPSCATSYFTPDDAIGPGGRTVRCQSCANTWRAMPDEPLELTATTASISSPTSAGMTPEMTHLFYATQLVRENDGGGNASEDIAVYKIRLTELREFLSKKRSEGVLVDFKIHAALAAAGLGF